MLRLHYARHERKTTKLKYTKMTKSEKREIDTLLVMHRIGMKDTVALGLSALIRSARTNKSIQELMEYSVYFCVKNHPDFII
jgi:hypothetical protein